MKFDHAWYVECVQNPIWGLALSTGVSVFQSKWQILREVGYSPYMPGWGHLLKASHTFPLGDLQWKREIQLFLEKQGPEFADSSPGKSAFHSECPLNAITRVYQWRLMTHGEDVLRPDKKAILMRSECSAFVDLVLKDFNFERLSAFGVDRSSAIREIKNSGLSEEGLSKLCKTT